MSTYCEFWFVLLVPALLVGRVALGRRLRLTSSSRRCLSVIRAADKLSRFVRISMWEKAIVTFQTLAIVVREVPARGIVDERALGAALLAEALRVHLADLLRVGGWLSRL